LLKRMHEGRVRLKNAGFKIAKTIKFMMNTVYGNSIRKPKMFKTMRVQNPQKTIEYQGDYVMKYADDSVTIKKCFCPHYYYPQYAKTLLDNYHEKMNKISEIVQILYCNVDSILVSEQDYLKLEALGWIHDDEFGKFRVDHVFTDFAIKTPRKWCGITIDGMEIRRPQKLKMKFEDFADNI